MNNKEPSRQVEEPHKNMMAQIKWRAGTVLIGSTYDPHSEIDIVDQVYLVTNDLSYGQNWNIQEGFHYGPDYYMRLVKAGFLKKVEHWENI